MLKFLLADKRNIVVVHCLAGKGRTGTLISCLMLYARRFRDPDNSMLYYRVKRFKTGGGVTHPSQRRYVHYFMTVLHDNIKAPIPVCLEKLFFNTAPHIKKNGCSPTFEIINVSTG